VVIKRFIFQTYSRVHGDEHPDTIDTMNNLASALENQGKLEEAAQMKEEVLSKIQRILGEAHPYTISGMSNLGSTLGDQGKLEEAAQMKQEVLLKRQRILGPIFFLDIFSDRYGADPLNSNFNLCCHLFKWKWREWIVEG